MGKEIISKAVHRLVEFKAYKCIQCFIIKFRSEFRVIFFTMLRAHLEYAITVKQNLAFLDN
jgi:hypothetical protein